MRRGVTIYIDFGPLTKYYVVDDITGQAINRLIENLAILLDEETFKGYGATIYKKNKSQLEAGG